MTAATFGNLYDGNVHMVAVAFGGGKVYWSVDGAAKSSIAEVGTVSFGNYGLLFGEFPGGGFNFAVTKQGQHCSTVSCRIRASQRSIRRVASALRGEVLSTLIPAEATLTAGPFQHLGKPSAMRPAPQPCLAISSM